MHGHGLIVICIYLRILESNVISISDDVRAVLQYHNEC